MQDEMYVDDRLSDSDDGGLSEQDVDMLFSSFDDDASDIEDDVTELEKSENIAKSVGKDGINVDDSVRMYLKDIGKIRRLTPERERHLAEIIADSDDEKLKEKAKNEFVEANLLLVISVAKRYAYNGKLSLDLVQEGNIGLVQAVDRFDYKKGFKFSTYAIRWIKKYITGYFAKQGGLVSVSEKEALAVRKLKECRVQMHQEIGREPTVDELADRLGVTPRKVRELFTTMSVVEVSFLSEPRNNGKEKNDQNGCLEDAIADEESSVAQDTEKIDEIRRIIDSELNSYSPRDINIIKCCLGLDDRAKNSYEAVASEFGVGVARVRQIVDKFRRKLSYRLQQQNLI